MTSNELSLEPLVAAVRFDAQGLVPVIAQDASTGVIRMFAYANAEALRHTGTSGFATFFSRSRNQLWEKGATSGHRLSVVDVRLDCDGDAVLYLCNPQGPSCHTGRVSCFFRHPGAGGALIEDEGLEPISAAILGNLATVIAGRRAEPPEKSYVSSLLAKGFPKINEKLIEEAGELAEALPEGDKVHTAHEAADLIFHMMVGLEAAAVPIDAVFSELQRRFGVGGHSEKAARAPKP